MSPWPPESEAALAEWYRSRNCPPWWWPLPVRLWRLLTDWRLAGKPETHR